MLTPQALTAMLGVLLIGWITLYSLRNATKILRTQRKPLKSVFYGFRQKMWMTVGLGILFFGFYLIAVLIGSQLINEKKMDVFFIVYNHPILFIYLGLLIFMGISGSIYAARMVIKYLYNRRNR